MCTVVNKGVEVLDCKVKKNSPCVFLLPPLFAKI